MSQPIALSWSRINVYRQCPKQFAAKYISKDYPEDSDNPAFIRGNRIHKQAEDYIKHKKKGGDKPKMGIIATNAVSIIDNYFHHNKSDEIEAERQVAVGHDWEPVGWFDSTDIVRFRSIMDMTIIGGERATILDWKTGKVRKYSENNGQLHLSSAIIFELYPDIQEITNAYLFLEHMKTDKHVFTRADHAASKAAFDVEYYLINENEEFEPKKNKYCFFYAIKEDCIYG